MTKGENGKANITMYSYTGLSSSTLFISGSGMENQRSAISRAGWSRKVFLSKIKAEGFLMFRTCHFCLFYGVEKTNSIYCYDPTYNFDIIWNLLIRCWPQGLWGASSSLNKVQFALRSMSPGWSRAWKLENLFSTACANLLNANLSNI